MDFPEETHFQSLLCDIVTARLVVLITCAEPTGIRGVAMINVTLVASDDATFSLPHLSFS